MLPHAEDSCTPASSYRGPGLHPLSPWAVSSHLLPIQLLPLMEIVRWLGPDRVSTAVLVGRVGRQRKCLCVEKEGRSFSAPMWSQYFLPTWGQGLTGHHSPGTSGHTLLIFPRSRQRPIFQIAYHVLPSGKLLSARGNTLGPENPVRDGAVSQPVPQMTGL